MTPGHDPTRHRPEDPAPEAPPLSPVPEPCVVPAFEPLRVRGPRHRLRGALRRARHLPATLLALTAAMLAFTGNGGGDGARGGATPGGGAPAVTASGPARPHSAARPVSVPVRIADAATVRLLHPGDRVDVIAAPVSALGGGGAETRVVARGAQVAEVPHPGETGPNGGALVVLSVPRPTAAALAGAGVTSQLAVTLC
ncbi:MULTISPECIES: hypothetical protein [unclassified Streptomyces]|uniref:hypothetical protein n=1 Tax=unclassified Streptomyces TaxID=2593676 RepID=UPI0016614578|nr:MULTISPECIES: hypothetical protein [unclassified Streptomyces]MBD0709994.1 hypothetical protein [Streptomyces sp. CBMA291]MBD0713812.1 hypothetical protein [Streptomyces sp. CBMA370]